jgi:tryptophan synthase alpha chain
LSRINACLEALKAKGQKALVPYLVAGDPSKEFTVPMMHQLVESGADIIELGIPFSDPAAEGPVIQLAHERALEHNTSLRDALEMVTRFRESDQTTPIVLMGYANPVEKMGYPTFAELASEAGVDGLLTVDMPPEEAAPLSAVLKNVGIDSIYLIAPTTTQQRMQKIADAATGYLYYVSLKGVTGAGHLDVDSVIEKLAQIRAITSLPVTVGFGIKDADSAQAIAKVAEGVVVGSALIDKTYQLSKHGGDQADVMSQASELIVQMRQAMDAI